MKPAEAVYDRTAIEYDLRSGNPYTERVRAAEASLLGRHARGRILDAGCGTGYHMRALDNITGVDVSREMVKLARKTGKPVRKADIENLPFRKGEFGTVLCLYSVLNVCDWRKAVKELCRVTRPEGRVIISVSSLYDKGYGNIGEKRSVRPDRYTQTKSIHISGHKIPFHLFTMDELESEFSSHNFSLMEFGSVFRGVQPHWGLWKRFSLAERLGLFLDRFRPVEYGAMYL
ncbi:MAG: methyltransferase domain-containing protein, partial [Candidatus Aenigmarchaeota archaeon]|nr:methyltransferase domain-containing protein [Candidatus Aenigmarchaeota archaeon]